MPKLIQYELQPVTAEDCVLLTIGMLEKEDKTTVPGAVFRFSVKDENKQERFKADYAVELTTENLVGIQTIINDIGVKAFNEGNEL